MFACRTGGGPQFLLEMAENVLKASKSFEFYKLKNNVHVTPDSIPRWQFCLPHDKWRLGTRVIIQGIHHIHSSPAAQYINNRQLPQLFKHLLDKLLVEQPEDVFQCMVQGLVELQAAQPAPL